MGLSKESVSRYFQRLQDDICNSLEELDGKGKFHEDKWNRPDGGGGRSRVILGDDIEKGGVNYSAVHGAMPEKITNALGINPCEFYATGVSIVLHPRNPWVPIIHMNVRYFETSTGIWWFGGGIDLTPHYIIPELARDFHNHLKKACDAHDMNYYPRFKNWADDYFFIKHRDETRGIGGIFFDRLQEEDGHTKESRFDYVKEVGESFVPIYTHQLSKTREMIPHEDNHTWQRLRRGRYVEFNLVWDRGTKFGLDTNGRTESILMSMPPQANWVYDHKPINDEKAQYTLSKLKKGIDWTTYTGAGA